MGKHFSTLVCQTAGVSDTDKLVHDIYFPMALRVILGSIGAFFFCIAPYELWRGVWPLNVMSPFFGLLMLLQAWAAAWLLCQPGC